MRILLVDQYGELGGAQRCLIDVAEGFSARGWELHAVCPDGPLLRALEGPCATVTAVPCGPFQSVRKTLRDALRMTRQVFTQAAAIRGIAAQRAIDAVYVNGPRMIPAAALARPGCPLVFHAHSVVTQRAAAALVRAGLAASGATVIASSHFVAHQWQQPSLMVLNGVRDCRRLRKSAGVTVAVLGRISPEKGQLEFVRAISKFGNPSGCRFVIAGATVFGDSIYEQRVRHEAEAAGVECLGWVDDVPAFLASVDILVVPSDETDATPRVILEAFSAGSTVIAFAAGGIPELIRNGVDGILVHERSAAALAQAMGDALNSPASLGVLATQARLRWREAFSVERYQNDVAGIVQDAILAHHRRSPLANTGKIAEA